VKAIQLVLKALEYFYPIIARTGASAIARDMESTFAEECDFRVEARRLRTFAEFLHRLRLREATVPRVYEELSTRRLLVMERLHGEPLNADLSRFADRGRLLAAVAGAMNVWVSSVTHCDFFHADVHAGNLLILKDGRVGFIDFGIVGTIEPKAWQAALAMVTALLRSDARGVAESLIQVGATEGKVDATLLAKDLEVYLARFARATRSGPAPGGETPDRLLVEIFAAGEKYGLHFPRQLFLLLKQYLYLDGYLRVVSPGLVDVLALGSLGRRVFG
jgi:predicted unusual protein kinase regulating ubiquinone biosynthesis (AarF/ABC1/UbiB family)